MDEFSIPHWGRHTGLYIHSDEDPTNKLAVAEVTPGAWEKIQTDIKSYKWSDGDFLLLSYPKTGKTTLAGLNI